MQQIALTDKDPPYAHQADRQLTEVFDNVLVSCATSFCLPDQEVSKLEQKYCLKLMWSDDTMMSYLGQLRGMGGGSQYSSLRSRKGEAHSSSAWVRFQFLASYSEATSDIPRNISKNEKEIDHVTEKASILCEKAET